MTHRRRSRAFTLLELLIATAATAVLMIAVLTVISFMRRDTARASARGDGTQARRSELLHLLRQDLTNARFYRQSAKGQWLMLRGYGPLNPETVGWEARPADVCYRLVKFEGQPGVLVREQRYVGDPRGRSEYWSDIAAAGVDRIALAPAPTRESDLAQDKAVKVVADETQWIAIPPAVTIEIAAASDMNGLRTLMILR